MFRVGNYVDVVCGRLCARLCLRVRVLMPGYKYRHIYGCRGGGLWKVG
jgi:hypothetical protein